MTVSEFEAYVAEQNAKRAKRVAARATRINARKQKKKELIEKVTKLRDEDKIPVAQIAREVGVSRQWVAMLLKEAATMSA